MDKQEICERVAAHLDHNRPSATSKLTFEDEIFKDGTVDSFAKLELTIFIEDEFGVQLDEERLASLGSIAGVASYVLRMRTEVA